MNLILKFPKLVILTVLGIATVGISANLLKNHYPKNLAGEKEYEKRDRYATKFGGQNKYYLLWAKGNENDWWWRNRVEQLVNPKPSLTSGSYFTDAHVKAQYSKDIALDIIKNTCEDIYKRDEETDFIKLREIWQYCSIEGKDPSRESILV